MRIKAYDTNIENILVPYSGAVFSVVATYATHVTPMMYKVIQTQKMVKSKRGKKTVQKWNPTIFDKHVALLQFSKVNQVFMSKIWSPPVQ
jgi:hypothetical protein